MLIGYARVSTDDQELALQLDALEKAGCERVFTDKISGAETKRNGLDPQVRHLFAKIPVSPPRPVNEFNHLRQFLTQK